MSLKKGKRQGVRDLGVFIGDFPTGKYNCITDVSKVKVGHSTIQEGDSLRTGVTVIMPNDNIFNKKLVAGSFILNGAGELSGLTQVNEWGILETPIALTNTMAVGTVGHGIGKWMSKKFSKIWDQRYVIIPVVGECDDSFLSDAINFPIEEKHVFQAIKDCRKGAIAQGSVGGGTGMVCCDFKGGIGSSSRMITIENIIYTIGVMVLSNFGRMRDLRVNGYPIGEILKSHQDEIRIRKKNYGSIIAVIGTDIPSSKNQINRLCKRAALGIGKTGSYASHGSGEIVFGFSTANAIPHGKKKPHYSFNVIRDEYLNSAYQAVIDATEEAILNSLTYSDDMTGVDGNFAPGIDNSRLASVYKAFEREKRTLM